MPSLLERGKSFRDSRVCDGPKVRLCRDENGKWWKSRKTEERHWQSLYFLILHHILHHLLLFSTLCSNFLHFPIIFLHSFLRFIFFWLFFIFTQNYKKVGIPTIVGKFSRLFVRCTYIMQQTRPICLLYVCTGSLCSALWESAWICQFWHFLEWLFSLSVALLCVQL